MNIRTKTTDYKLSATTSEYLEERLKAIEKILGDHAKDAKCDATLGKGGAHSKHGEHQWFAELTISRPGEERINATAYAETLHAAIDKVKDDILKQLRHSKSAAKSTARKEGAKLKRVIRGG